MVNCEALLFTTISNIISGVTPSLIWMILFIWGVKKIAKEMPNWISQIGREKNDASVIKQALAKFRR